MSDITKCYCVFFELRGSENARLKVIGYESTDKALITDADKIIAKFPPSGFIFSPSFTRRNIPKNYHNVCLVGEGKLNNKRKDDVRGDQIDDMVVTEFSPHSRNKVLASKVSLIDAYGTISQRTLRKLELGLSNDSDNRPEGEVYASYNSRIFGPFKYHFQGRSVSIKPGVGKEVYSFDETAILVGTDHNDREYVIERPDTSKGELVACYTDSQLLSWINNRLSQKIRFSKSHLSAFESVLTKDVIEKETNIREKAIQRLHKLYDSQDALLKAFKSSEEIFKVFERGFLRKADDGDAIAKLKEEIITLNRLASDLAAREKKILSEKSNFATQTKRERASLEEQLEKIKNELKVSQGQKTSIKAEYDKLIAERAAEPISPPSYPTPITVRPEITAKPIGGKYQQLVPTKYRSKEKSQSNLAGHVYGTITDYFTVSGEMPQNFAHVFIEERLLLSPCRFVSTFIAVATGNADVFQYSVPPDLLNFNRFAERILFPVLDYCQQDLMQLVVLVVDGFNISHPSAYFSTVIDVHTGLMSCWPGREDGWPPNLKIMVSREIASVEGPGLPVATNQLFGFAALPYIDAEVKDLSFLTQLSGCNYLFVPQVIHHPTLSTTNHEHYADA